MAYIITRLCRDCLDTGVNPPGGDVKLEIADAGAGSVMATVTP